MPINIATHKIRVLMLLSGTFDAELGIKFMSIRFLLIQLQVSITKKKKA